MTDKERDILDRLGNYIQNHTVTNDFLVELLKLPAVFLNLKTIPQYAKENNISYQGVKTCRNIKEIFNVKFVIDNQ